jgi:hypothetical protein
MEHTTITKQDLNLALAEQLLFIDSSLDKFDKIRIITEYSNKKIGNNNTVSLNTEVLAKPMSVVLRVLLRDTDSSRSILNHLGIKDKIEFIDTADPVDSISSFSVSNGAVLTISDADEIQPYLGLISKEISNFGNLIKPHYQVHRLEWYKSYIKKPYSEWWTQIIYNNRENGSENFTLTREELVLAVANKDGGAHIDKKLKIPIPYNELKNDDLEYNVNGETLKLNRNLAYASLVQIGWEVLNSIEIMEYIS